VHCEDGSVEGRVVVQLHVMHFFKNVALRTERGEEKREEVRQ
jgi:hypothetical protein